MSQSKNAARFRALHDQRPLVLPNAWDASSARIIELAGAPAVATTSAGIAWALGRGDGQQLGRDEMLHAIERIVRSVEVPVNADVESGYGSGSTGDVAETVRALVGLGVAGINLEDSPGRGGSVLMDPAEHAARIQAAREAALAEGGDLVVNARIDVYLFQAGAPETRFDATMERAKAYFDAGADCVFVPGVIDAETIGGLVRAVGGPLNVMAMPGAPDVARLAALGVARVSVGPAIAAAALGATRRAALELLGSGTYRELEQGVPFPEANGLFTPALATV
jgi:2-methylisocitrate lyase-like PEP mutase family enzyme